MYSELVTFIRDKFRTSEFIPLHSPVFSGNEKKYVMDCIDSTYVSSVGKYVDLFEQYIRDYTGAKYAVATVNGTAALHMSLILAGVQQGDLVLTQSVSFIATCNAISYLNASPLFIDIDRKTLGMSAESLEAFLKDNTAIENGECIHKESGRRIRACVPMHTFGHPVEIDTIAGICERYQVILIEDAAESIGSFYKGRHTGSFGKLGVFSFNGNKTVTCGGGGVIITNDEQLGKIGKHLTTQAKVKHRWDFVHDSIGYNYRLPNLNAAMACAQMEEIETFIRNKRELSADYASFFANNDQLQFVEEPINSRSNYWLNAVITKDYAGRNELLQFLNDSEVMARPCWTLMHKLSMFTNCYRDEQVNAEWIADRLVNIPSSYRPGIV